GVQPGDRRLEQPAACDPGSGPDAPGIAAGGTTEVAAKNTRRSGPLPDRCAAPHHLPGGRTPAPGSCRLPPGVGFHGHPADSTGKSRPTPPGCSVDQRDRPGHVAVKDMVELKDPGCLEVSVMSQWDVLQEQRER